MDARRLLVIACSQRKRSDPGLLPASERYDGPLFRVVRKFRRDRPADVEGTAVYVLSAAFGLIAAEHPIPHYDRRMTPHEAQQQRPVVLTQLAKLLRDGHYERLLISAGMTYQQALAGYAHHVPAGTQVLLSSGAVGRMQADLRDWLYGTPATPPSLPAAGATRQMQRVALRGVEVTYTAEQALAVGRRVLAGGTGHPASYQSWYVLIDGQRVAPKWLVSQLTGLSVGAFVTQEALRVLTRLGVAVHRV